MTAALVRGAAGALFAVFVWRTFRFAMGLRSGRIAREEARRAETARGRRIVAELPARDGTLLLLVEDAEAFAWGGEHLLKKEIVGCRLLLNGGVMASVARAGTVLPEAPNGLAYEGRERWDVRLYTAIGSIDIACGTVREGVSREIAQEAFAAVRAAIA